MEFTTRRSAQIVAFLLISAVVTQALYTTLYMSAPDVDRTPIWSAEAVIFTLMAVFAASLLANAGRLTLGWGAILVASILNIVQVGIGLMMFGPFFEAAGEVEALRPAAMAVVDYSFFIYNAAKTLIGLAALIFGLGIVAKGGLAKVLGFAAALFGGFAAIANAASMALGRDVFGEMPLAGGSGVIATFLLALCVTKAIGSGD